MPRRVPHLLTASDLPSVELQSAVLDGELYAIGDAWRSVSDIDDPASRAASLSDRYGDRIVVAGRSAAWVWGARGSAPLPHDGLVSERSRHKAPALGLSVREVLIDDDEIVPFGRTLVTTPVRTVVDLARTSSWSPEDERATRDVAAGHGLRLGQALNVMDRRRRVPYRIRAVARLRSVLDPIA